MKALRQLLSLRSTELKWAPHPLTFLSGVLIVLAFPPWNCWPLIWFALVPWFFAIQNMQTRESKLKSCIMQGFWLSYFMSLGGFYWVAYALQEFGNLPWSLSILGLQLFCFFGQPQFPIIAPLFAAVITRRQSTRSWEWVFVLFVLSFFYAGIDWILPKLFLDTLGHAFYRAEDIRQLADIGGAQLLTFLVFLANFSIWHAIQSLKTRQLKGSPIYVITFVMLIVGWLYGYQRNQQITQLIQNASRHLQAAAIQANIGDFEKLAAERGVRDAATRILDIFTLMTQDALNLEPKPEIVIWPETSFPSTFRKPHSPMEMKLNDRIENLVRQTQVPLLFGGYDHLNQKDYNAFFLLEPQGDLQTYRKSILLLFGEYIPGAETFKWIKDAFPQVGNFGRGMGPDILKITPMNTDSSQVLAGPMICYEALFPHFSIESAKKGAQFLMNITNDSWFGKWGEPQLHLALSIFRSIETRLPMLRSTNTGISALVLPNGEITAATPIDSQKIMNVSVPIISPVPTLIKKWGDWFGLFALVAGSLGMAGMKLVNHSRRR